MPRPPGLVEGGAADASPRDPDLNAEGSTDQDGALALLDVLAGGACPWRAHRSSNPARASGRHLAQSLRVSVPNVLSMSFCDLHTHSNASDGSDTPADLARIATRAGLTAIALTDHDTTAGHEECRAACDTLGVEFIPGVELSGDARTLLNALGMSHGGQLHILGLFVDAASPELSSLCLRLRQGRDERVPRMLASLASLGMPLTMEDVRAIAGNAVLCRPHVAFAMVARGYVPGKQEAFDRYIGLGGPAYVEKDDGAAADCISAIHASGGVAILAHPIHLKCRSDTDLRRVLSHLHDLGLDGVEVLHSDQPAEFSGRVAALARDMGLAPSGGSDYHGSAKSISLGSQRVPVEILEGLRARRPAKKKAPSMVPGA